MLRRTRVPGVIVEIMCQYQVLVWELGDYFCAARRDHNMGITAKGLTEHHEWPWEAPFLHGVFS